MNPKMQNWKMVKHYKITGSLFCFPILAPLDRNARNSAMSGHKFRLSNTCLKSVLKTVNYLDFQVPSITVVYQGNKHLNFRKFLSNIKNQQHFGKAMFWAYSKVRSQKSGSFVQIWRRCFIWRFFIKFRTFSACYGWLALVF